MYRRRPSEQISAVTDRLSRVLSVGLGGGAYTGIIDLPGKAGWVGTNGPNHQGGTSGNAFLWVVANIVVKKVTVPAILMIGEKGTNSAVSGSVGVQWNVPGGGPKDKDNGHARVTAMREFNEETGTNINNLMRAGSKLVEISDPKSKNKYFMLRVNESTEWVSKTLGLKNVDQSRYNQMTADLSKETRGWVWVTKGTMQIASGNGKTTLLIGGRLTDGKLIQIEVRNRRMLAKEVLSRIV